MRFSRSALGLLAACILANPARAVGQSVAPEALRDAVVGLRVGTTLRVARDQVFVLGKRDEGEMVDPLVLVASGARRPIPLASIDSLWVRDSSADTWAALGVAVGGLAFGVWGAGVAESDCHCTLTAAIGFGAVGALGGAIVGGVYGALTPRWRRIFP